MRSIIVLIIAFTMSGCSHSQAVRKPPPRSVAAWWKNIRELNRPDPYDSYKQGLKQQFTGGASRQQQRLARKYYELLGKR